ncbi:hypothetical protein [Paenibacillus plantarum]|uniref:hypothetical protein n=1 Tax=Paenibacillus plantarum TaxID=2654975 RepID=UPI001490F724|nr:hypothetical protein [Paenibacillus plantarum]
MTLLLFFDDKNLLVRDNLQRVYEKPEPAEDLIYRDPLVSTSNSFPSVWQYPETG